MASAPIQRLGLPEFVALMGMTFATVAFAIDAMLPAMSDIAAELAPNAPNQEQLIITSFVLGMGIGTLFTGPLADAFGRKPVVVGGAVLYIVGAAMAWAASSLETVLAARVVAGLGAAGPRIAAQAIIRDLYSGRQMAQVMSFAMIMFTLVPAVAPLIGSWIIWLSDWRGIFIACIVFSLITTSWLALRQPETLAPEHTRPFQLSTLRAGIAEVFAIPRVVKVIAVLSLVFAILFTTISTTQQVFVQTFDRADEFPYWFCGIALISALGSIVNARIVIRLGMRRVIALTLGIEMVLTVVMVANLMTGWLPALGDFAFYIIWLQMIFFIAGLTIGNLTALGMEPLGHLAGIAASIISAIATVVAVIIAVPIGLGFDGTPLPLAIGVLLCSGIGLVITQMIEDVAPEPEAP